MSRTKRGAKGRKQKNKKAKKNRRRKNKKAKKNRRRKNRKAKKNRRRRNRKARRNRRRKNRKARRNRRRKNRKARRRRRRGGRKGRKGRKGKKGQLVDDYESDSDSSNDDYESDSGSSNDASSSGASSSSTHGSGGSSKRSIPYCPPGYYKKLAAKGSKKKCGKRVARVIAKAFGKLFCITRQRIYLKTHKKLTRKKFLIRYFKKYQTKNNYLPRRALRKYLRQRLPKKNNLRKKLLALRTRCVKKLKRRIDTNNDFKVSRKEFIRYFRPILKKVKCEHY